MRYDDLVLMHPNLLSYWRLDEASGDALDGNASVDGTVGGTPTRQATSLLDASHGAAAMTFASGDNIDFGDVYDFAGTAPFSVVAWINMSSVGEAIGQVLCKRGTPTGTGTTDGWQLAITTTGTVNLTRQVSGSSVASNAAGIEAGKTYMVAGTYDGHNSRSYRFGTAGATVATGATDERELSGNGGVLRCAALSSNAAQQGFPGTIQRVALYNAALEQAILTRLHLTGFRHQRPARHGA